MTYDLAIALKGAVAVGKPALKKIRDLRRKRLREAKLAEIGDGTHPLLAASEDEAIEIIERFESASQNGAAVINLRLMFRILKGLAEHHPQIFASDFARLQRHIADLSREEVILLAVLHKYYSAQLHKESVGAIGPAWEATQAELVPSLFPTEAHMRATAYGAQRSGLLLAENSVDSTGYLTPSPIMDELVKLSVLDESLWRTGTS